MSVLIDATAAFVSLADGKFDTRYRYLKATSSGQPFRVVSGPSWSYDGTTPRYAIGTVRQVGDVSGWPSNTATNINVGTTVSGTTGKSLDISPTNGILIQDPTTGLKLFDSSMPLLHVINQCNGSQRFETANPTGAAVNITRTVSLSAIDPIATHVLGAVQVAYDTPGSVVGNTVGTAGSDWWFINGSFVMFYEYGEQGVGAASGQVISGRKVRVCSWSQLTFRVSTSADSVGAGFLLMIEQTNLTRLFAGGQWNPEGGGSVGAFVRPACTLYYKLKAVAFS